MIMHLNQCMVIIQNYYSGKNALDPPQPEPLIRHAKGPARILNIASSTHVRVGIPISSSNL